MPFKLENKEKVLAAVEGLGGINKIEVKSIFGNGNLLQEFRSFCHFEESEENILFLQAIRAFKESGGKGNIAYQIKKKFLLPEIEGAVNLKDSTLKPWKKKYEEIVDEANEEGFLSHYIEKPTLNYSVSMGIYVFQYDAIKYVPDGVYFDFPDLVRTLIERGERVASYPFKGYWLDIGRPDDYAMAVEEFDQKRKELLPEG